MAAFGTVATAYSTLAEALNDIADGIRGCAADGKGAVVDTWNENLSLASAEVARIADFSMTTAGVCEAQDGADRAMEANDPTPLEVEKAKVAYKAGVMPLAELQEIMQQRADALEAHTGATESTQFPDVPGEWSGNAGGKPGSGDGDEDGGFGNEGSDMGDDNGDSPSNTGGDTPSTASPAPQPSATSPSTTSPAPTTTLSDTDAGTGLSGDNTAVPQTQALSSAPGQPPQAGGAQGPGGGMGQGGAFTANGTQLNSTPNTAPTRQQQRKQQQDEKVAANAENAALMTSMALPDALHNAQSYNVPGTPNSPTNLSGSDSRLGQMPAPATQGQSSPPSASPSAPPQTSGMPLGSGAHMPNAAPATPTKAPPKPTPAPEPVDVEKEARAAEETRRRAAQQRMNDEWK